MLAIRLKRTGRSGHAQFRVIIQDSRAHPKRGKVVAYVGSYDPHTKTAALEHEEISEYLGNGAKPSDRVAKLLKKEGVKLPSWVKVAADKKRPVKNVEKMRRNAPPVDKQQSAEPVGEEQPTAEEAPPTTDEPTSAPEPQLEEDQSSAEEEITAEQPTEGTSPPSTPKSA